MQTRRFQEKKSLSIDQSDMDRRAFEKFSKFFIDDRKKKKQTLEGLVIIVTDEHLLEGVPDRILKFFSLFHCSSHDAHYVTTFDARASSSAFTATCSRG